MDEPQTASPLAFVQTQLATMLKSDVTIDAPALSRRSKGAFHNFVSPSISVLDVQGGSFALRKGASQSSDVHLLQLSRGSVQVAHADGCITLKAGQFIAFRGAEAYEFRHDESIELLAVYLPERAITRWLPNWRTAEFVKVANYQAEGRLSFDIARDLLYSGSQLQPSAAELVGETVTQLLARSLAMSSVVDASAPDDLAEAARRKVRHFCRVHLGTDLTVESVARGTGLSRASLHRLFRDQPHTLMQWVQLERLEACRRMLDARGLPRRTLTEIALSQGFKSPAHFSAAFRQRYGLTPREYRAKSNPAIIETLAQKQETQQ